jgi:hypothetical protein
MASRGRRPHDLPGLTASEARALFLVAGPASATTPAVKGARELSVTDAAKWQMRSTRRLW